MASFLKPLLVRPGEHELHNERSGVVVATHLVGAFDSASRRTGLLHHKSFPAGHGLVIAPTNAIHTFFMHFAIDVAFVSKEGRIVKIRAAVPPWRLAGALWAYAVIELPAGTLERTGTVRGDRLIIL
jgi:uncharacterized protein